MWTRENTSNPAEEPRKPVQPYIDSSFKFIMNEQDLQSSFGPI